VCEVIDLPNEKDFSVLIEELVIDRNGLHQSGIQRFALHGADATGKSDMLRARRFAIFGRAERLMAPHIRHPSCQRCHPF